MGDNPEIACETHGPVAIIRLNRADKLNALTYPMIGGIKDAAEAAERDGDITGIVITGEGRAFSAGLDAEELAKASARGAQSDSKADRKEGGDLPALFSFLPRISKPVISAVNGPAAGGGFVLAMMSDLRFFGESGRVTTVFSKRGLIAEHGTSFLLPRMVGLSRSLDLLWSSRMVGAEEALRFGLADRVFPDDQLIESSVAYVKKLAEEVSPRSIAVMKEQVYRHLSQSFEDSSWETTAMVDEALAHPDATEGVMSFVERRPPRFASWTGGK